MVEAMVSSCHDIIIEKLKDFYDQGFPLFSNVTYH